MIAFDLQFIVTSIGWSLIHFLWQGSLITLAYWIITRNQSSIHAKYWTGMILVVFSLLIPVLNFSSQATPPESTAAITTMSAVIIAPQQLSWDGLAYYITNQSLPYLVMLWALTVLFLSIRLIRSWITLASIQHRCDPKVSGELKQYIKNIAIKLDLPTIPLLKISKQVMVPAAYGLFKPTVLLPLSLISQIPRDQLEAVIKHELCHLKRNDFIHNIIQLCADILLFFHPGIRWMNNDIRHIREQCCDQMVLSHDTKPLTYAKALTNIAAYTNGMNMNHSVQLGINDGMLLNRVKFLLQNKSSQSSLMIFLPFLMLLMFIMILIQPAKQDGELMTAPQAPAVTMDVDDTSTGSRNIKMGRSPFYPKLSSSDSASLASGPVSTIRSGITNYQPVTHLPVTTDLIEDTTVNQTDIYESLAAELNNISPVSTDILPELSQPPETFVAAIPNTLNSPETVNSSQPSVDPQVAATGSTAYNSELSSFDNINSIKPLFKKYVAPEYPRHFWYNQIEQEVIATFKIAPNGRVRDIEVTSLDNNYVAFEQEVLRAMRRWKFDETSLNNSTLQRTYQQIFSFAITDNIERNCEMKPTGTRLSKAVPCNK